VDKVTTYTIPCLSNGTPYFIAITSMNSVGAESAKTGEITVTPKDTFTLTVTTSGSGTVSASGLTCNGNTCSGTYGYNTAVNITASGFNVQWSGCDSSNGSQCTVTMITDKSVTATFLTNYTVSFSFTGSGAMTCTPTNVSSGESFSCSLYPDSGYYLESLFDNTVDVTSLVSNKLYSVGNVIADHTIAAAFHQNSPVLRLWGADGETWYSLIQSAYNAASSGDDILTLNSDFYEELNFNRDVSIRIQGGCNADFNSVTGFSIIHGKLTISNGNVIIENLILQ
jgi:hypothetical protein